MRKFFCHTLILYFVVFTGSAQSDTTIVIDEVRISAPTFEIDQTSTLKYSVIVDSIRGSLSQNVGQILKRLANIYIKNYGLGSLSTPSIRGGSAAHTLVLWNDVPIQSPMLGVLDFSLLPVFAFSNLDLAQGRGGVAWGDGAVSSILHLSSPEVFNRNTVRFHTSAGSWQRYSGLGQIQIGNENLQSVTKVGYQTAENDFTYTVSQDLPPRAQKNAAFDQLNILQELHWKMGKSDLLSLHGWYQDAHREIPPLTTQVTSEAIQDDVAKRIMLLWKHWGNGWSVRNKIAYFNEDNLYQDPQLGLEAINHFDRWMYDVEYRKEWSPLITGTIGYDFIYTEAKADSYPLGHQEARSGIYGSLDIEKKMWSVNIGARQAWIGRKRVPLMVNADATYDVTTDVQIGAGVNRVYRFPTMNDRFWSPGGNAELQAEHGWSLEGFAEVHKSGAHGNVEYRIGGFSRRIDDWILWAPREGEVFFSANNIGKVWSRGIEQRFDFGYTSKDFSIQSRLGYDYILSTYEVSLERPAIQKGEQLLYTPKHQASMFLQVQSKGVRASYQHTWTGITQGVNEVIPHQSVGTFNLGYQHQRIKHSFHITFSIVNLWDVDYYIIERRPMPGLSYLLSFDYVFNKN